MEKKNTNRELERIANINKLSNQNSKKMQKAKKKKDDEFYTRYEDIAKEMIFYRKHFKGKTVFMNCDDPEWSNFWKFFLEVQQDWGIKKIISTHFKPNGESSYALISEEYYENGELKGYMISDPNEYKLKENGGFETDECIEFLKEADIVCTNPPFSLWKEYISLVAKHKKKFVIIGNIGAVGYKEFFEMIKNGKAWTGHTGRVNKFFKDIENKTIVGAPARWYTNLGEKPEKKKITLTSKYKGNEKKYPEYANYKAIEVGNVSEIPYDYNGVMGVPTSIIDHLNTDQFEIIGYSGRNAFESLKSGKLEMWNSKGKTKTTDRLNILFTEIEKYDKEYLKKRDTYYVDIEGQKYLKNSTRLFIKNKEI